MKTILVMGIFLTRLGWESSRLYAQICRWFLKSMFPSEDPTRTNAWLTAHSASSTVRALMDSCGGESSVSIFMSENLEDRDRVFPAAQEWVNVVVEEKVVPPRPMFVLGFGALKSNAGSYLFINKVEVSADGIGLCSWQIIHGSVCGNWHSKWASKGLSDRSHDLVVTSAFRFTPPGM
jgi:hypothetical protein